MSAFSRLVSAPKKTSNLHACSAGYVRRLTAVVEQCPTISGCAVTVRSKSREGNSPSLRAKAWAGAVFVRRGAAVSTRCRAGDSFFIEAGKIHEGINTGGVPVKVVATFVAEKGKPLTSPAP
jgi:hypothetical protein